MNANEHYAKAEEILRSLEHVSQNDQQRLGPVVYAEAQVHATLALAARPIVVFLGGDTTPEMIEQLNAALNPDISKPSEDQ
jgi:hypothetical protein